MHIICCYTNSVHPKARNAIDEYAPGTEYVETLGLFGYNEAISSRWNGEDDLVVIEGDKEISPGSIQSFERCSKPWCLFTYDNFPAPYTREAKCGLGYAKFTAELQRIVSPSEYLVPDLDWMPCPDCNGAGCWRYLDSRIAFAIMNHGISPHVHGKVTHHHNYPLNWAEERGLNA